MDSSSVTYLALAAAALIVIGVVVALRRRRLASQAASTAPPEAVAFLERTTDGEGQRLYALHRPLIVIGRSADSDIPILPGVPGAASVSRRHAQIRREDADHVIEDLGSKNGIRVNGLVTHRNLLRDGYRVSFGGVEFVYRRSDTGGAPGSAS